MSSDDMKKEENASEAGISAPEHEKQDMSLTVGAAEPDMADDAAKPEKAVLKPGAQLAAFRVAAGIEQEQVATSLKMTVRQVRELEADHYEALHGVAISRGFVRAYAKMLQVDPEPLVAMFAKEDPVTASKQLDQIPKQNASPPFVQGSQPFGKKRGAGRIIWLILIIIAVALAAGYGIKRFALKKKAEQVVEVEKQTPHQAMPSENSAPEIVVTDPEKAKETTGATAEDSKTRPDAEKPVQTDGEQDAPQNEGDDKTGESVNQDVTPQKQQEDKNELKQPQPEKMTVASAEPPGNVLTVRFSGPSKIQVLKADASVLQELDGKAGEVHQLEIHEPVTLVVEKALNVQAEFRKQSLALRTARRSPEARIELK